jgi:hypothetical protein
MAGELLLSALRHVWATLAALKIDMALMGGIAVAAWQHLRNTRDVDLLVSVQHVGEQELLQKLMENGFKFLHDPPFVEVGGARILQLTYEPPGKFLEIRVDLFLAQSAYHQQALARRNAISLPGMTEPVFILSCEDLILFKLMAGRLIDRSDSAHLFRANRGSLDIAYLKKWTRSLNLEVPFRDVWDEAFGEHDAPPI